MRLRLACLAFFVLVLAAGGGCSPAPPSVDIAQAYLSKTPLQTPGEAMTMEEAMDAQAAFVEQLIDELGPPVGYKVGLTSTETQTRFGAEAPIHGVLLRSMLSDSGWTGSAALGARLMFEGDLMVRVRDETINTAETDLDLLAALDAVYPFVEVPDLMYVPEVTLDATMLAGINVGARLGVLGTAIPLDTDSTTLGMLGQIRVELLDDSGGVIAEGRSAGLLGHPINVVRWLRDALREEGQALQAGELISLGSLTPLTPVTPETGKITARYTGLAPKAVEVVLTFTP